jgi:CubicO group peptidase (beta-lactamase class C family)
MPVKKVPTNQPARKFLILIAIFVFGLPTACQTTARWAPHEGDSGQVYPEVNWQKADTPEQLGWSSKKLAEAQAYSAKIGSAAVMIVDDGVVVAAWGDVTRKFKCHSMRKSLLSALIGIHVDAGNIDLTQTLEALGIDDDEPALTPAEKQATVGDLIKSRSGVYHEALGENQMMRDMRPARHSHAPGTFWYYNNWDFNALGTIFEQQTHTSIFAEFDQQIAKPLQMEDFNVGDCRYVSADDVGKPFLSRHNYYNFRMSARDLARFGLLFLREGRWRDRQIIPANWVRKSTASYSQRGIDGGYGYMWWTGVNGGLFQNVGVKAPSYYASGMGGHKIIVLPYRKLVIVHRVNTDGSGRQVSPYQIGRLLWHILDAAGETRIGPVPTIESAAGVRLNQDDMEKLFSANNKWVSPNTGIFPGGESLVITCSKDGKLRFSTGEDGHYVGRWRISGDKFTFKLLGMKGYFHVIREGTSIKFFDPTGTLFGKFRAE